MVYGGLLRQKKYLESQGRNDSRGGYPRLYGRGPVAPGLYPDPTWGAGRTEHYTSATEHRSLEEALEELLITNELMASAEFHHLWPDRSLLNQDLTALLTSVPGGGDEELFVLPLAAVLVGLLLLTLAMGARLVGRYGPTAGGERAATVAYECGFVPFAALSSSSLFLYYRLAVFFVVFEAELIFLYPWATSLLSLADYGALLPFGAPAAFIGALLYGYLREIRADALRF